MHLGIRLWLLGFASIWIIPQKQFNTLAFKFYEMQQQMITSADIETLKQKELAGNKENEE